MKGLCFHWKIRSPGRTGQGRKQVFFQKRGSPDLHPAGEMPLEARYRLLTSEKIIEPDILCTFFLDCRPELEQQHGLERIIPDGSFAAADAGMAGNRCRNRDKSA
jgi:hypothetical protein